ncbi:hypothetical protein K493DRAFT_321168 [Basidiobolus meristosporus CBS 931.73]|uniref:Chitin-binding type-2 domain-containing protein n=1 Tax=Basidiobolus meristosporus CBS 931.73 TaxID=1314790 RepID=A0A1Y1X067_9FUNG|nr:hypothetical protein K493DRAFT_321168 [Basidiobolus meristosporus CBS 931.73]|eukprot:ORX78734.1 hypothetical protein K493DRAFT_321168 [Basidiobolus meristosporus CBS 931.73]
MKFATSFFAGLTLAASALALPLDEWCAGKPDTALQCVDEYHSGVMWRCQGGKMVDYSCFEDQVCVKFTWQSVTSAACAQLPPTPSGDNSGSN